MHVVKRDGAKETVKLEKISKRIERQCRDLKHVDAISIAQKVVQGLYDGVTSKELDKLATETAYAMTVNHPEYDKLATRLAISALHKDTESSFSTVVNKLYNVKDTKGNRKPMIDEKVYKFIKKNAHLLDSAIDYSRDFLFDFFGFKTLERSYLLKIDGKIVERPQMMWMRVACGIHAYDNDIDGVMNTYKMLSTLQATHATPTLFNAGTPKNQLSSCFLISMKEDSINGIYDTVKEVAQISQSAGGIGLHIHDIRSKGSNIYGTNGTSNGIVPMLKVFESTCRYVDQCFAPNTLIETSRGMKAIENIIPKEDEVMTSSGFNKVLDKKEFDVNEEIYEIQTVDGNVNCTGEHLFMVIENKENHSEDILKEKIKRGLLNIIWKTAKDLSEKDMILTC